MSESITSVLSAQLTTAVVDGVLRNRLGTFLLAVIVQELTVTFLLPIYYKHGITLALGCYMLSSVACQSVGWGGGRFEK